MKVSEAIKKMNELGSHRTPFFFMADFELQNTVVFPLSELASHQICFHSPLFSNVAEVSKVPQRVLMEKNPLPYAEYKASFDKVYQHLLYGNSYLVNLTKPTRITMNHSLKEVFHFANAPYKLLVEDKFVVFSPEIFVRTDNNYIFSYPMKGTIDASVENAAAKIINDEKELAEHNTIVDLIRNDLSIISKDVKVLRFRYIDNIKTSEKNLLQVSSEICGRLPDNWRNNIGGIMFSLLPAGSVSGAPKRKTVEIIRETEQYTRGYYTGVCGVFNGENLDSCVMIRFIENKDGIYYYKSGGGITLNSNPDAEYNELLDKIYVPLI